VPPPSRPRVPGFTCCYLRDMDKAVRVFQSHVDADRERRGVGVNGNGFMRATGRSRTFCALVASQGIVAVIGVAVYFSIGALGYFLA
jgi:hypothetical protein